jgi:hypothetical protein
MGDGRETDLIVAKLMPSSTRIDLTSKKCRSNSKNHDLDAYLLQIKNNF